MKLLIAQRLLRELRLRLGIRRAPHKKAIRLRHQIPVGSVRREADTVRDLDILVISDRLGEGEPVLLAETKTSKLKHLRVVSCGARHWSLEFRTGKHSIALDVFFAKRAEKAFALFHYTGSKDYVVRTRAQAKRQGWLLNQYGLFDQASGKTIIATRSEAAIAHKLGVGWRAPQDRA